jgi:hypothetical protein
MQSREDFKNAWVAYMNSQSWRRLKRQRMDIAGNQCEGDMVISGCPHITRCDNKNVAELEMHHLYYPDFPYAKNDSAENVVILCRECHELEHCCDHPVGDY